MRNRLCAVALASLACLGLTRAALAHDETTSTSLVEVGPREVRWRVEVGLAALAKAVPLPAAEGTFDAAQLAAVRAPVTAALAAGVRLSANGLDLAGDPTEQTPLFEAPPGSSSRPSVGGVAQTFVFRSPEPIRSLTLRVSLFSALTSRHRAVVRVVWGGDTRTFARVGPSELALSPAEMRPSTWALVREFLPWGVEHIVRGYDHIAFLLALLLGVTRLRDIVAVITAFTAAHTLTLVLSTLELVRVPAHVSEAIIAASIVYVAIENLGWVARTRRYRWVVSFLFGLVHGLAFATDLRARLAEIGGRLLVPVLSFNAGVELGQLAIVALILPILTWLRRPDAPGAEARQRRLRRMASVPLLLIGLYWLADRVFGGSLRG